MKNSISNQKGALLIIFTFALVAGMGFLAFMVDVANAYKEQKNVEAALDAGVLAGVKLIADSKFTAEKYQIEDVVFAIAKQNGLTEAEIQSGDVRVGKWSKDEDTDQYTFEYNVQPFNAVFMKVRRNTEAIFGKALDIPLLKPSATSVAAVGPADHVKCVIPFAIDTAFLTDAEFGDTINVSKSSPGNWGKIDLSGNMSSSKNFVEAMRDGLCENELSIGDVLSPGTGNGGLQEGFDLRMASNPVIIIPLVEGFSTGNSEAVTVTGFMVAELISQSGTGSGWSGLIKIIEEYTGNSIGDPDVEVSAKTRTLINHIDQTY